MLMAQEEKSSEFPLSTENNAVGGTSEELRVKVSEGLRDTLGHSVFWTDTVLRNRVQAKIHMLGALQSNWDSYGAPAPSKKALENAARILRRLSAFDLARTRVVPSAEGGIGFCFGEDDRYADIESSNEGDVIGVRYTGMQPPIVIETDGTDAAIDAALEEIIDNHII
jgi:hypothetical protein